MLNVCMVGCGAIGASVLELLQGDAGLRFSAIVTPAESRAQIAALRDRWAAGARLVADLAALETVPDVLVECAGHAAIEQHVLPALARGIPCVIVSTGAFADAGLAARVEAAARAGRAHVQLLSGAMGGIDALAAARVGGLDEVVYTGRKPPGAWKGTPAEGVCDLDALTTACRIFRGNAAEAALLYPKNANVAATLALAGLGMQRTEVQLYADPAVTQNVHQVAARGAFGEFELTLRGRPLAANPKTSALTVYSVVRALRNLAQPVAI